MMVVKTFMYFSAVIISGYSQMVQVDESRSGYAGSQVDLGCQFINSDPPVKISQVTWQKFVNGSKQNVAIANPALGVSVLPPFKERVRFKNPLVRRPTPSLEDTTITFFGLRLSDEAAYICEYTTFPAGNRENTVNLTVYARPMIQMSLSTPAIVAVQTNQKMTVATCVSANGKPPGVISWDTGLDGEENRQEIRNPDGTFTVRSDYIMVPTKQMHQRKLTCVTTYHNEKYSDSVTLNIQYEPDVTIEGYDGNWYLNRESVQLVCQADANPPVSLYQWRFLNGSIPDNVEVRDNLLLFKGPVTYDLAGTYLCDATNSIGTRSAAVEVNVTEAPLPVSSSERMKTMLGWVVGLGLLIAVVSAIVIGNRQQEKMEQQQQHSDAGSNLSSNSPSPAKRKGSKKRGNDEYQNSGKYLDELTNTADYVSYRLACHKEDYLEQHSPPIHPPLSFLPQNPTPQHLGLGDSAASTAAATATAFKFPAPVPGTGTSTGMGRGTGTGTVTVTGTGTLSRPGHSHGHLHASSSMPAYTFPKEQYV